MRVKLIGIKGYNYTKDGTQKIGTTIAVQSPELMAEDDNNGNYEYGYRVDTIFIPHQLVSKYPVSVLQEYLGKEIQLDYEKRLGDRYERLVDIIPIKDNE